MDRAAGLQGGGEQRRRRAAAESRAAAVGHGRNDPLDPVISSYTLYTFKEETILQNIHGASCRTAVGRRAINACLGMRTCACVCVSGVCEQLLFLYEESAISR